MDNRKRFRVPLWGKPQGYVAVDPEATKGATLGVDLYRADGSVVTEADLAGAAPAGGSKVAPTLWQLIQQIPANISALAALVTSGFAFRASDGTWSTSDAPSDGNTYGRKNGAWAVAGAGSAAMLLLGTATVSGSDATSISVSGLDLSAYRSFVVDFSLGNATGSTANLSLTFNADTTATNYNRQVLFSGGTTLAGSRGNEAVIGVIPANETVTGDFRLRTDFDGIPRAVGNTVSNASSTLELRTFALSWTNAANVTAITLSSSVANAIAVGSRMAVYGLI